LLGVWLSTVASAPAAGPSRQIRLGMNARACLVFNDKRPPRHSGDAAKLALKRKKIPQGLWGRHGKSVLKRKKTGEALLWERQVGHKLSQLARHLCSASCADSAWPLVRSTLGGLGDDVRGCGTDCYRGRYCAAEFSGLDWFVWRDLAVLNDEKPVLASSENGPSGRYL